jgi:hypothetical protein
MPEKIRARQGIEPAAGLPGPLRSVMFEEQDVHRIAGYEDDREGIVRDVDILERIDPLHIHMVQDEQQDKEYGENEEAKGNLLSTKNQADAENNCQQDLACIIREK